MLRDPQKGQFRDDLRTLANNGLARPEKLSHIAGMERPDFLSTTVADLRLLIVRRRMLHGIAEMLETIAQHDLVDDHDALMDLAHRLRRLIEPDPHA